MCNSFKKSFQPHNLVAFVLRICERAAGQIIAVVAVACQFGEVFVNEEMIQQIRRQSKYSKQIKFFEV